MYEGLAGALVDTVINTYQSRAARYILPTSIPLPANTPPVLRDVRRAGKNFSYTGRGAFFFIFEKEWGAQKSPAPVPVQNCQAYTRRVFHKIPSPDGLSPVDKPYPFG